MWKACSGLERLQVRFRGSLATSPCASLAEPSSHFGFRQCPVVAKSFCCPGPIARRIMLPIEPRLKPLGATIIHYADSDAKATTSCGTARTTWSQVFQKNYTCLSSDGSSWCTTSGKTHHFLARGPAHPYGALVDRLT